MKILNFGSCNIDHVYSLDHIVRVGETETTDKTETFPGGKGLNQSIALAKAGAAVYHAGCVGSDGDMLIDVLRENGVDTSLIERCDGKNGHAIIQVGKNAENSIFLYPGSNERVTEGYIDRVLEHFEEGDVLLLQNEISNVRYLVEEAYKKRMFIVFNPSPFNETVASIDFKKLDCIVVNEVEAAAVTGSDDPDESIAYIRKKYPDLRLLLTLGERGSIYSDRYTEIRQATFSVNAVDTTAAGDTFTGYFVAGLAKNGACAEILKVASAASAIAVSRKGASSSIPTAETVAAAMCGMTELSVGDEADGTKARIERYISENLAVASTAGLAEYLGYSTVYTGTLVKRLLGEPFTKLLLSKRCKAAAEMLKKTDLSVDEIIRLSGYENRSFFRNAFKEKYGKSPSEYRKQRMGNK